MSMAAGRRVDEHRLESFLPAELRLSRRFVESVQFIPDGSSKGMQASYYFAVPSLFTRARVQLALQILWLVKPAARSYQLTSASTWHRFVMFITLKLEIR